MKKFSLVFVSVLLLFAFLAVTTEPVSAWIGSKKTDYQVTLKFKNNLLWGLNSCKSATLGGIAAKSNDIKNYANSCQITFRNVPVNKTLALSIRYVQTIGLGGAKTYYYNRNIAIGAAPIIGNLKKVTLQQ